MFCLLFSWRKASICKKLIKKIQCRLKLLKSKRCVIATHFRQDIAQLWKNGYERIAYNRIDDLCMDEGMILVYEILEQYSKFILLNLSYIRKHKDLPIDVNEAISTLVYASARCSDVPELRLIRKLFGERYGQKLIVGALHLHPGNHVNRQVKEKLTLQSVSEYERNRMLHEIVKDFFFKPAEFLAHDYQLDCQVHPPKVAELYEVDQVQEKCTVRKNICPATSTSHCIVIQSSPSITEIQEDEEEKHHTLEQHESSVIEVVVEEEEENEQVTEKFSFDDQDEVQEFKTPIKKEINFMNDQDQRFFLFGFSSLCDTQLGRSESGEIAEYMKFQVYNPEMSSSSSNPVYPAHRKLWAGSGEGKTAATHTHTGERDQTESPGSRIYNPEKCQKEIGFLSDKDRTNEDDHEGEEIQEMGLRECMDSPLLMSKFKGSGSSSVSVSPSHVHPKLPDYDEIEAKFKALKMVHLQNKIPADVVDGIYSFMKLFV